MNKKIRDLCFNVNSDTDTFVGLDYKDNQIKIYFPLGYQIPDDETLCRNSILKLIEAINITKIVFSDEKYGLSASEKDEIPINSYIWLIKDYLTNDLYYDTTKTYKQNIKGKINWKRTIRTKFYISDNNIVYLNPVIEKHSKEQSLLTEIQLFCLKESIEKIGWIFGNISLPSILAPKKENEYYLKVLESELHNSFNDRKKALINHLIRIIREKTNNSGYINKRFGTYNFHVAWEKMVNKVYGNIASDDFFPKAKYHLIDNRDLTTHKLIPDTIFKYKNDLYIIDSKYYKYGIEQNSNSNSLPSTGSIDKQIAYGKYASNLKERKYKNVYNAFIIPYNKENNRFNTNEKIKYIGYATSENVENNDNYYEKIAIILIDTTYLMDCYFKNEKESFEDLVEKIQNIRKESVK